MEPELPGRALGWGQALSAVLLLGLAGLALRSSLAVAFHSARMYFLAPTVFTAGTGVTYIASAFTSTPLVSRIVGEFVPDSVLAGHEHILGGLLRKGTLFYGIEQLLTAAISVGMLLELSTTAYAAIHPIVSWLVLAGCALLALPLFRKELVVVRHARSARLQQHPVRSPRSGQAFGGPLTSSRALMLPLTGSPAPPRCPTA